MSNSKMLPAIVAIGFNRPGSLSRLLTGLDRAWYPEDVDIPLVIAIDYQDSTDNAATRDVAEAFIWEHGSKRIIAQKENLGLKRHVLACGDLTQEYGAIIMLEDDIFPGHNFYAYTIQALYFYQDEDKVAGISLYNHKYNVIAGLPFEPLSDSFDNYFLQFASSWGQAWSTSQWDKFRKWYSDNPEISETHLLPDKVRNWSDHSWLKHFDHYLVRNDLFFVYPRFSHTTNFSDVGTHAETSYPHFQVSIEVVRGNVERKRFSYYEESLAIYDAYFEPAAHVLAKLMDNVKVGNIVVDLYGTKPLWKYANQSIFITSRNVNNNHNVITKFGMQLKPVENNIIYAVPGDVFFLVKSIDKAAISKLKAKTFALNLLEYFYGKISQKTLFQSLVVHLKRKVKLR